MAKARKNFRGAAAKHGIPREEGMQFIDDAKMGNLEGVIQFIDKYGKDGLEVRDRDWAPPGQAVWKTDRKTALFHAVWEGRKDVVEYLIAQGANVNGRDRRGYTPLFVSREPVMAGILIAAGADVNGKCDDGTPIMFPTTAEMIEFLVAQGADVNARDSMGATALMLGAEGRHAASQQARVLENLTALLDAGADPDLCDRQGRTALMRAAAFAIYRQGNTFGDASMLDVVKLLLSRGADPELKDDGGYTAEMIARRPRGEIDANVEQQQAVGDILGEAVACAIAERSEKTHKLFTEGPEQVIGIMKPLQWKR